MSLDVIKTDLKDILYLRNLFLQENNFQIRYNSRHERGWSDSYLIIHNQVKIGYGSVAGYDNTANRDTVFEFYIIPSFRNFSSTAFLKLLQVSKSTIIECQSNDILLTTMLYQYCHKISPTTVLLGEHITTDLKADKVLFRKRNENEVIFEHRVEPVGNYVLELNNEVVATGGFFLHYNMPFADLYMEVKEDCRRKGLGSFLIQELKKHCYLSGRVPAARTGIDNVASKATLIKAGLKITGFVLSGAIGTNE
jgi:GNAT superfamily N-acetyltransferase